MKLPKKVIIAGKVFRIVCDPSTPEAGFHTGTCVIRIGTKYKNEVLESFLHECLETLLALKGFRLHQYDNQEISEGIRFAFNHAEFSDVVRSFAYTIKDIIKKG